MDGRYAPGIHTKRWNNNRRVGSRSYDSRAGPMRCAHCAESNNPRIRDVVSKTHRTEDCRRVNHHKASTRR